MVPFLNEIPRIRTLMSNDDATEREIRKPLISQALQQVSSGQSEENEAGQGLGRTLGTSGVCEFVQQKTKKPADLTISGLLLNPAEVQTKLTQTRTMRLFEAT